MPFNLGFGELFVIAIVAIIMFGGQLPDVARKVGRGFTEFKRGMNEQLGDIRSELDAADTREQAVPPDQEGAPPADWEPPSQDDDCPGMR